jgi:hypothetical protein
VQAVVITLAAYGVSRAHFEDVDPFVPVIISLTVFGIGGAVMLAIAAVLRNPARWRRSQRVD